MTSPEDEASKDLPEVSQRRGFDAHLVEHISIRHMPGSKPRGGGDYYGSAGWRGLILGTMDWLIVGGALIVILGIATFAVRLF